MSSRHDDLTCAVQGPGGILDQAVVVLRRKLAANPHDAKALLRLGDAHRCPVAAVGRPFPAAARAGEPPVNGRERSSTGAGPADEPRTR